MAYFIGVIFFDKLQGAYNAKYNFLDKYNFDSEKRRYLPKPKDGSEEDILNDN